MLTKSVVFVALLCLFCEANRYAPTPIYSFGRCPDMAVQQNFSVVNYTGTWYIQMQYNLDMIHGDGNCALETLEYDELHNVLNLQYKQQPYEKSQWTSIFGTAIFDDVSKQEGRFNTILHNSGKTMKENYLILGTDYEVYSVVYSCKDYLLYHKYSCWLMSRTQNLWRWNDTQQYYIKVDKVLSDHGIDPYDSTFSLVDQTACKK